MPDASRLSRLRDRARRVGNSPARWIAWLAIAVMLGGCSVLATERWLEMLFIMGAYGAAALAIESLAARLPGWLIPPAWLLLAISVLFVDFFDQIWLRMFFIVTLYATLGIGLNVVVGLAGLLDLGYVAFFAVGAYVVAIFGSPLSPQVDGTLNYWLLLPMAILIGAAVGALLGLPVLPLRGDYLAIVTLGFGEIIRLILLNRSDITRGSSGLPEIQEPALGSYTIDSLNEFYAFMLVAALVVWFVTSRLRDSRIGRAWEAIREDEDVAAAMGVNTTRYKLMAFTVGAAVGALGGAIYAPFITFVNPSAFTLIVSINVLAVVVIGGMGSTQGVIAGAFILIGAPEFLQFDETRDLLENFGWLRSIVNPILDAFNDVSFWNVRTLPPADEWGERLSEYRFIVYGALLVLVMLFRPFGIFPSRRRVMEFEHPPEAEQAFVEER